MTTTIKQQRPKQQHWDDDQDGDDCFFETLDRVPSSISIDFDLPSSGSDSDQENDVRVSFASAIGPPSCFRNCQAEADDEDDRGRDFDYGIWMAEPMSIQERRRLLLHGMGLTSSKNLRRDPSSRRFSRTATSIKDPRQQPSPRTPSPSALVLHRSRSYSCTASPSPSHSSLLRSRSEPPSLWDRLGDHPKERSREGSGNGSSGRGSAVDGDDTQGADDDLLAPALCRIKNLDTGKEFVVSEVGKDGTWGKLNDLQTGHQLTLEEFEKCLGHSPIIKEVMRRAHLGGGKQKQPKSSSKSRSSSCRKKGGWLKNIMFVAGSVTGLMSEKDKGNSAKSSSTSSPSCGNSPSSSELMKVRQHGKPYKELTGLCMCQEIQAHQGSIWTIKFSTDARYLASAGEDRVVHVWQALERNISGSSSLRRDPTQQCMAACGSPDPPPAFLGSQTSKRAARKGLGPFASSRRSLPDNIVMSETIFSLSDKPVCSFHGHLDDVLDLSWSQSQHLLSSSMDKTVRLWDMETGACLKLFAHNDYVTCIQFNPIDDGYFISGSLDAKVRIWSISDRQVVDWCDLHEMVTAACYTPDGQGALVGSHKGSCRFFDTSDGRLCQKGQLEIRNKKKKSHAKKVTGFQFAPGNASEVMITSADSQIRVFDGFDMIHKFRGFRNTSSQISASFTSDGKYVVCASEDSHVYVWKREGSRSPGFGGRSKGWATTRSHEHFPCRDVSVAIPWPGSGSCCRPQPPLSSSSLRQTDNNKQHQSTKYPLDHQGSSSALEDMFHSSRSHGHPPLPKKSFSEHALVCNEDLSCPSRSVSGIGSSSFASASPSLQAGASVSVASSSSPSTSWGWYSGSGSKASSCVVEEASAWGLVIVTAGLGGDIRIYQNFGLPVRLGRQTNLF